MSSLWLVTSRIGGVHEADLLSYLCAHIQTISITPRCISKYMNKNISLFNPTCPWRRSKICTYAQHFATIAQYYIFYVKINFMNLYTFWYHSMCLKNVQAKYLRFIVYIAKLLFCHLGWSFVILFWFNLILFVAIFFHLFPLMNNRASCFKFHFTFFTNDPCNAICWIQIVIISFKTKNSWYDLKPTNWTLSKLWCFAIILHFKIDAR